MCRVWWVMVGINAYVGKKLFSLAQIHNVKSCEPSKVVTCCQVRSYDVSKGWCIIGLGSELAC